MFDKTAYIVKERVGFLKLADVFDVFEADSGQQVAIAMEKPGWLIQLLRLVINKRLLPTKVLIAADENAPPLLSMHRGMTFLRSKIDIRSADGTSLGYFKSKLFSLGGAFFLYDRNDQLVAQVKGDWKGWNFRFLDASGAEIGTVSKKWGGLAKEMFTSADSYVIRIGDGQPPSATMLLIAAGLAVDTVYKEKA